MPHFWWAFCMKNYKIIDEHSKHQMKNIVCQIFEIDKHFFLVILWWACLIQLWISPVWWKNHMSSKFLRITHVHDWHWSKNWLNYIKGWQMLNCQIVMNQSKPFTGRKSFLYVYFVFFDNHFVIQQLVNCHTTINKPVPLTPLLQFWMLTTWLANPHFCHDSHLWSDWKLYTQLVSHKIRWSNFVFGYSVKFLILAFMLGKKCIHFFKLIDRFITIISHLLHLPLIKLVHNQQIMISELSWLKITLQW